MGTWLQSFTQTCCDGLSNVYQLSRAIASDLTDANQHYTDSFLSVVNNYSGSAAEAFLGAASYNQSVIFSYANGLYASASAVQTLQQTIVSSSAAADARLANVSSIVLPPMNSVEIVDELISQALEIGGSPQATLSSILTTGSALFSTNWPFSVNSPFLRQIPGANPLMPFTLDTDQTQLIQAMARNIQSILQTWSDELHQAYITFYTNHTPGAFSHDSFAPTIIEGNPFGYAGFTFNHEQGDNSLGAEEDCGLVSSADVLNQFGIPVDENDVVLHAEKYNEMLMQGQQSTWGGVIPPDTVELLGDYGVATHVETYGSVGPVGPIATVAFEQLANEVKQGDGVIIQVNADALFNDGSQNDIANGVMNHDVTVTGVAVNAWNGQIEGFYVNDSGEGVSADFVTTTTMQQAWINAQGGDTGVVTNQPRP